MNPLYSLVRMLIEQNESSLDSSLNSFDGVIKCCTDVIQSLHDGKVKLEEWEVYIETLIIKIIFASKSIHTLGGGMEISSVRPGNKITIVDRSSVYLLTRSIIEAFLTLEYLYFNDESKCVNEFRYKIWKAAGLMSRQNVELTPPPHDRIPEEHKRKWEELKRQKEEEKETLDKLMADITSNQQYQTLSGTFLGNFKKYGTAKYYSWHKLQNMSILKTQQVRKLYKLCSNHAHSEYISAIQINEISPLSEDPELISGIKLGISYSSIIISTVIILLKERFKSAEIIYNGLPQNEYETIQQWYSLGVK